MSKRGPGDNFGGEENSRYSSYPGSTGNDMDERPQRATAAQMAKRKIANAKKPIRRSESPAVATPNMNGASGASFSNPFASFGQPQPDTVNFSSNPSFSFGNTTTTFGQAPPQSNPQNQSGNIFSSGNPQQNGTSMFGQNTATPSFGASFNSSTTQPLQNGIGSNHTQPSTTSFSFGQTQPSQPNGTGSSNAFGGFGKQADQTSQNGTATPPASNNLFGGFGKQAESSSQNGGISVTFGKPPASETASKQNAFPAFGQKPQENGGKPLFASSQSEGSKPTLGGTLFGSATQPAQANGGPGLFGAKPAQQDEYQSSTPGAKSVFDGFKPTSSGASSGKPLFQSANPSSQQTPNAAAGNIFSGFGRSQQPNAADGAAKSNVFGGLGQKTQDGAGSGNAPEAPTPNTNIFGGIATTPVTQQKLPTFGSLQAEKSPPKTNGNLFAGFGNQPPATGSIFQAGSTQQDSSMESPANIPQKSSTALGAQSHADAENDTLPESSAVTASAAETPAPKPRSLFDRLGDADKQKFSSMRKADAPTSIFKSSTTNTFTPSTKSVFGNAAPAEPATPLFGEPKDQPTAPESHTPKAPPPKNLFDRSAAPPQPQFGSSGSNAPSSSTVPTSSKAPVTGTSDTMSTNMRNVPPSVKSQVRELNLGFLEIFKTQDPDQNWTELFQVALKASQSIIESTSGSTSDTTSSVAAPSKSDVAATSAKPTFGFPKAPAPSTPAPSAQRFASDTRAPNTAPVNRKRVFEEEEEETGHAPVTEKRSKPNEQMSYPKLPDTASKTSKLFESMLDKSGTTGATETARSSSFKTSTTSLFSSATAAPASSAGEPTPAKPTQGFMPSFAPSAAGAGNALAAFGSKADSQSKKDQSKRKAEDYDSDEEDEATWAARDAKEQEAKRQKIEEASKNATGFMFTKPAAEMVSAKAAPQTPAKLFGSTGAASTTPATTLSKPASSLLSNIGASAKGDVVEKAQGTGDNTWKPSTPLKFGGADTSVASSKTTGLFGSSQPLSGLAAQDTSNKLAPPAATFGFGFGAPKTTSANVSMPTTPGATTDGETSAAAESEDRGDHPTAADEPSDEARAEPQDDMAALLPAELEGNEVLFELPDGQKAQCKRWEMSKEQGNKMAWVVKATGRVYILKNRETGKVRFLFKQLPLGQVWMNFEPVKGIEYTKHAQKPQALSGAFVDHITLTDGEAKLTNFFVQFRNADVAGEVAQILRENTPK